MHAQKAALMSDDRLPPNLHLIGGEMYAWSDLDPARGPQPARGGVLRRVVTELLPAAATPHPPSVLVAGPHDDAVIADLLAVGARVSWLCRSLSDAERAAAVFPSARLLCGTITKLDPADGFDLVVALDGLDRLSSAEADRHSVTEAVQALTEAVAPGGRLVLLSDNPLGIQHSAEFLPAQRYDVDADWWPVFDDEDQRPSSLQQVTDRLAAGGLSPVGSYAVFPTLRRPTVLIGEPVCGDTASALRPLLSVTLSRALTEAYRGTALLIDPRRLVRPALRAGAESAIAPGWLTIAGNDARPRTDGPTLPAPPPGYRMLVGAADDPQIVQVAVTDGGPRSTVLVAPRPRTPFAGMRPVTDLSAYPGAAGRVFEERLLQACGSADLPALRAQLGRFADWIGQQSGDGTLTGPVALVTPADTIDDGYELSLVAGRWQPAKPVPVPVVVARAFWSLAVELVTTGRPHPWGVTETAAELTAMLLAVAGRSLDPADLRAAIDLQVAYDAADRQLSLSAQQAHRVALLGVQPGAVPVDVHGFRELTEALWRQRYQSSHLLTMLDWTEQILRSRDYWHSRMDWEIQLFRRSWSGRLIMVIRSAYRAIRRDIRLTLRDIRRPSTRTRRR